MSAPRFAAATLDPSFAFINNGLRIYRRKVSVRDGSRQRLIRYSESLVSDELLELSELDSLSDELLAIPGRD